MSALTAMLRTTARALRTTGAVRAAPVAPTRGFHAMVAQPAPQFTSDAVVGQEIKKVSLSDYLGKWVCLVFYPKDFTFVCPTELVAFSDAKDQFAKINTEVLACSTDTAECHLAWVRTPRNKGGLGDMNIPIIADVTKDIAADYGVLNEDIGIAFRGLFIINPDGVVESVTVNNFPVGRSVDEAIRVIQAFQFVAENGEVCPANWKPGSKTMKAHPDKSQEYFQSVFKQ